MNQLQLTTVAPWTENQMIAAPCFSFAHLVHQYEDRVRSWAIPRSTNVILLVLSFLVSFFFWVLFPRRVALAFNTDYDDVVLHPTHIAHSSCLVPDVHGANVVTEIDPFLGRE